MAKRASVLITEFFDKPVSLAAIEKMREALTPFATSYLTGGKTPIMVTDLARAADALATLEEQSGNIRILSVRNEPLNA